MHREKGQTFTIAISSPPVRFFLGKKLNKTIFVYFLLVQEIDGKKDALQNLAIVF